VVIGLGCRVRDLRYMVSSIGFMVYGLETRVQV
jgi:hypothetical protein